MSNPPTNQTTDKSENCEGSKPIPLCGSQPVLDNVDLKVQKEQGEKNDRCDKIKQLQMTEAEVNRNELITDLLDKNSQIKELLATIFELRDNNRFFKGEIDRLRDYYEYQLKMKNAKHAAQLISKDEELNQQKEQIKQIEDTYGICSVELPNFGAFWVLKNDEIVGPGWTVIQQRINGGEDFNRNWEAYKNGFGKFTGDFFLGLEKIHRLTNDTPHELYIHMEAFEGGEVERKYKSNTFFARYDNFRIAGEDDKYRLLSLGSYSGNTDKDRMRNCEHSQFSTFENELYARGGWWFNKNGNCNLNGRYFQEEAGDGRSNWWCLFYSLKTIKMVIRQRNPLDAL